MKRTFLFIMLTALVSALQAQVEGGELGEVTVKGSRTIQKNDALWILPTENELKHSTNAYSLLGKLGLEGIRIDPAAHTLTAIDNRGGVSVRINDVPATVQDLLSIDMDAVVRIEYSDRPGLRYGEDVAYSINIVVKPHTSGYTLGTDLTHDLTRRELSDNVFGRFNIGKSEWGLDYSIDYSDRRGARASETADYHLTDGSIRTITRQDLSNRTQSVGQTARLTYSLADTNSVFQMRLTYNGDLSPNIYRQEREINDLTNYTAWRNNKSRSYSPALDIYLHHNFHQHQQLTTSATITHIHTNSDNLYKEETPYVYNVMGRVWSMKSEVLYENHLKPFALTLGLQYNQKFTDNEYSGDAQSQSIFRSSEQYVFSQIAGKLFTRLQYTAGLGISRRYYRQGEYRHDLLVFRPRLSMSYPIAQRLRISYDYQRSQYTSQIAQTNDVTLKVNSMELLVGNPALRPNVVTEHTVRLSYQRPRLNTSLMGYAKLNSRPNMHRYLRTADNIFIDTQENQHHINLLMTQAYARYDLIPEKLDASLVGAYFHMDNKGWEYRHHYNSFVGTTSLNAYLGRWALMAYLNTGFQWLEGEVRGKNGLEMQFVATYQKGPLSLSLYCRNPFRAHPLTHEAELVNENLHRLTTVRDGNQGNYLGLNVTYRLSHGRKYQDIQRKITLEDHDAGILK